MPHLIFVYHYSQVPSITAKTNHYLFHGPAEPRDGPLSIVFACVYVTPQRSKESSRMMRQQHCGVCVCA